MIPDSSCPAGATLVTRPEMVSLGRASTETSTSCPGAIRAASASSNGTTSWNGSAESSTTKAPLPGAVLPAPAVPVPLLTSTGNGAVPPGARGVTAEGGDTTSPVVPLIAVTVPDTGAVM